jgi:hypothetical protein
MGLDAFLMPQEPSPIDDARPLSGLDEVLISPPITLSASGEGQDSTVAVPPKGLPTEAPSRSQPHAFGGGASAPNRGVEVTSALAAGAVIVPPTVERRTTAFEPARPGRALIDDLGLRYDPPSSAPSEIACELGDFLATAGVPILSPLASEEVDEIEREFISKSPLMETAWRSTPSAATSPTDRGPWRDVASPHSAGGSHRSEGDVSTPSSVEWMSNGAVGGPDLRGDIERTEERLSQVVIRLEQAVERLGSPSLPLGQRPRPFRGRIDG